MDWKYYYEVDTDVILSRINRTILIYERQKSDVKIAMLPAYEDLMFIKGYLKERRKLLERDKDEENFYEAHLKEKK
jgi:hypothetical protein